MGELQAMLREQAFRADAILLQEVDSTLLKPLARLCRHGTRIVWNRLAATPNELAGLGFEVDGAGARYAPRWPIKGLVEAGTVEPTDCVVVGAGLAGSAVAASLALRGWRVQVLDAGDTPAAGASSLPAGLLAPHQSPDDNLLSRLSRSGVRTTLQACERLLAQGRDWAPTGVLEQRGDDRRPVPDVHSLAAWTREADADQMRAAGLPADASAWWHATAGWVKPAALVQAWLAEDAIQFRGGCAVHGIVREGADWCVRGKDGSTLARATLVVVAAAGGS
ncbi:MAG: FAD-dependent oxidoreductase, partial [Comamonadaceae bacterium]